MDVGTIDRIREVLSGASPLAVYLFGSMAANRARQDSDVDLAVLPAAPFSAAELMHLRAELSERLMRDVDLIDLSRATTVLRKEVVARGRLLFETDANRRAEFEMYALSDYARLNEERAPVLAALGQPVRGHA